MAHLAEELGLDYPLLSDSDRKVAKAYGLVKGEGKYPSRWTIYIGKDGKILFVDKDVKTKTHGDDIAKKLKELGVEAAKKSS